MSTIHPSTPLPAMRGQYYHPVTGAIFVPDFFHQFILPTIPERSILPMQPLNWEFGVRPDRPFDVSPALFRRNHGNPVSLPRWPGAQPQYPTAYYLEQLRFWEDGPLPEERPDNAEQDDGGRTPGLLRVWFKVGLGVFILIPTVLCAVAEMLFAAALEVLSTGKRAWKVFVSERTWEFALSALVATQIVRILPGMGRILSGSEGRMWNPEPAPLYVLMIPNSNQWCKLFDVLRRLGQWLTESSKRGSAFMRGSFVGFGIVKICGALGLRCWMGGVLDVVCFFCFPRQGHV